MSCRNEVDITTSTSTSTSTSSGESAPLSAPSYAQVVQPHARAAPPARAAPSLIGPALPPPSPGKTHATGPPPELVVDSIFEKRNVS